VATAAQRWLQPLVARGLRDGMAGAHREYTVCAKVDVEGAVVFRSGCYVLSIVVCALLLALGAGSSAPVGAEEIGDPAFARTWERFDRPVAEGQASRTWLWGPALQVDAFAEPYVESTNGERQVQYFQKSRMERTPPDGDPNSIWYVTNGLLVNEMVSGLVQVGDATFDDLGLPPADINIAGDPGQHPTYADIKRLNLRAQPATPPGTALSLALTRDNAIVNDPAYAGAGATAAEYVGATQHTIAAPFWTFMGSTGLVWQAGGDATTHLFPDPYYATGYPITEAYWSTLAVGGRARAVLWQCFERRCLTYTPDNAPDWQVESGNVGEHYFNWRYGSYTSPPISLAPEALANDGAVHVFREQSNVTLSSDLVVDVMAAGQYDDLSDLPDPTPSIAAGTVVNSYFVHADQVGAEQPVAFHVTLTFPDEILGVALRDGTLVAASTMLGAPATHYPTDLHVGFELSSRGAASAQDSVTLTPSRHSLVIAATVYDVVDQLRVITSASGDPGCATSERVGAATFNAYASRAAAAGEVSKLAAPAAPVGVAARPQWRTPVAFSIFTVADQYGSGAACPRTAGLSISRPLRLAG
jgi:hypothetical protein